MRVSKILLRPMCELVVVKLKKLRRFLRMCVWLVGPVSCPLVYKSFWDVPTWRNRFKFWRSVRQKKTFKIEVMKTKFL